MKLLLCCGKTEPFLKKFYFDGENGEGYAYDLSFCENEGYDDEQNLNGKVIGECDFEVEKIFQEFEDKVHRTGLFWYQTSNLTEKELLERAGLTMTELSECLEPLEQKYIYGKGWQIKPNGYAIHIKNLTIYDNPKELSDYYKIEDCGGMLFTKQLTKIPTRMQHVSIKPWEYSFYNPDDVNIMINIKPEKMYKLIDGEITTLIYKRIIKNYMLMPN